MKLAFLISVHTDPEHLARLVKSLPDESEYFVHVDLKSDMRHFKEVVTDPRVHFIEDRVDVVWGSLTEVAYQISLVRACLKSNSVFDYIFTLSGMDYPLWSNQRMLDFLKQNIGKEFIQGLAVRKEDKKSIQYLQYRFFSCRHWRNGSLASKFRVALRKLVYLMGVRKPLDFMAGGKHYQLYKGSAWWAITPSLARYILDVYEGNAELVNYFKTSFGSAETFFQTVTFNSPFRDRCILTEGDFTTLLAITPLHYINYDPIVHILTEDDYPVLMENDKMFCRKLVTGKSDKLSDMIDEQRKNKKE